MTNDTPQDGSCNTSSAASAAAAKEVVGMREQRCESCRAWNPTGGTSGQCRFSPPVWRQDMAVSEWPRTSAGDWCAQWRAEPEPAR